jgi:hypothetical protein
MAAKKPAMRGIAGNTHTCGPADQERARHVLLRDDLGRLTLRRLRPWHRILARCGAARLDRDLAAGASPETNARLATRAMQLTSAKARRDLATSVHRILAAAGQPAGLLAPVIAGQPPRIPLNPARISQVAAPLAHLAGCLTAPGPVRVQGVAMISQLLADGTGPLYSKTCGDDLGHIIEKMTRALSG